MIDIFLTGHDPGRESKVAAFLTLIRIAGRTLEALSAGARAGPHPMAVTVCRVARCIDVTLLIFARVVLPFSSSEQRYSPSVASVGGVYPYQS